MMSYFEKIYAVIGKALVLDRPTDPEVYSINFQRSILLLYIMAPLHLAHIILFWNALTAERIISESNYLWRIGIISAHSIMLGVIFLIGLLLLWTKTKNLQQTFVGKTLPFLTAFLYLVFGAAVCTIDQSVTNSISPYLNASMAVALVYIIRPPISAIIYSLAYITFMTIMPLNQPDPGLLLSVNVNGLSATALGFGLSLVLWRFNALNLNQKRQIEKQTSELEDKNSQLEQLTRTDVLTGLCNRMYFTEKVKEELARIERSKEKSTLMMLDIDNFKEINDRFGHPFGDLALITVATIIDKQLRTTDTLARFGGDEFAVLLPDTPLEGAHQVAEKLLNTLEQSVLPNSMTNFQIAASIGLTSLVADGELTFESVYHKVDLALYQAKKRGKNCIEIAR
jgi:diguanylate cyclase